MLVLYRLICFYSAIDLASEPPETNYQQLSRVCTGSWTRPSIALPWPAQINGLVSQASLCSDSKYFYAPLEVSAVSANVTVQCSIKLECQHLERGLANFQLQLLRDSLVFLNCLAFVPLWSVMAPWTVKQSPKTRLSTPLLPQCTISLG